MVSPFTMPPAGFGPGSHAEEGEALRYPAMPQDMATYTAHIPDAPDGFDPAPALSALRDIAAAASRVAEGAKTAVIDPTALDPANRRLLAETLGQGEVSITMRGVPAIAAQESVFAGVWILQGAGVDRIEVGPVPTLAAARAFAPATPALGLAAPRPGGLVNAPSLLVELLDRSAAWRAGDAAHVVNLTLLPHSESDLDWLAAALGEGSVKILSRGYGACRIEATATPHVWRVGFYNSTDALILDTYEVTSVPEAALAAAEDLSDSAGRILEVVEALA